MKKRNPIKLPPLFNTKKEYLKIISNPKKVSELSKLLTSANKIAESVTHPTDLIAWLSYCIEILPDFENKNEFIEKLKSLVNEYYNEPERSNTTESC